MDIGIVDVPERAPKVPELVEDIRAVDESGKAGAFTVPADEVPATLRKVHAAAKYIERSARKRGETVNDDGTVTVVFTVGKAIKRPRKLKDSAAEDAAE